MKNGEDLEFLKRNLSIVYFFFSFYFLLCENDFFAAIMLALIGTSLEWAHNHSEISNDAKTSINDEIENGGKTC